MKSAHRIRSGALVAATVLVSCIIRPAEMPTDDKTNTTSSYPLAPFVHSSGVVVVLESGPDFGTAAVVLSLRSGSADEPKGKAGLAHLVEHLVFDSRRGESTLKDQLEALGAGEYNGMTSADRTRYYAVVPARNLGALLRLFADALADPLAGIGPAEFEHERQVVREEARYRTENGTPGQAIGVLTGEVFPETHPYAHPTAGTAESIATLTLEDAQRFARERYRADVATIVVTGPSPNNEKQMLVVDALKPFARPGPPELRPTEGRPPAAAARSDAEPPQNAVGPIHSFQSPAAVPTLWIGWSLPPSYGQEGDIERLLVDIVGGVFFSNVYEHDRDIAHVTAGTIPGAKATLFFVRAALKEGLNPQASADSLIRQTLHDLTDVVQTPMRFEGYKRYLGTSLLGSDERIGNRALELADSAEFADAPTYLRARPRRLFQLKRDDVVTFFRKYLTAERAHLVLSRPLAKSDAIRPAGSEAAGDAKAKLERLTIEPSTARQWARNPGFAGALHRKLDNGLEVVVLPRPGSPTHTVLLGYRGGAADGNRAGVDVATLWAMRRKANPYTWDRYFTSRVNGDLTFDLLRAQDSDVGVTLHQFQGITDFDISWPPQQFLSRMSYFEKEDQTAPARLGRSMNAAVFGSNRYGRTPTVGDIQKVTPNDVHDFVHAVRHADNGILVIVGDVDAAASLELAGREFAQLDRGVKAGPPPIAPQALDGAAVQPGKRLIVEGERGASDAEVTFQCVLPPSNAEGFPAASVFGQALRNALFDELREEAGSSYQVNHSVGALRGGTTLLSLHADVDYPYLATMVASIRQFVDHPATRFLDSGRLARARVDLVRSFNSSFETTQSTAMTVLSTWARGWPLETWDTYPDRIVTVDFDEIARVAEHCRANWTLGLLGEESFLRPAVAGWNP